MRWRKVLHACALVWLVALVAGCAPPAGDMVQGGGLPSLRHLDWGYAYYQTATWSPDGRWIALLAGSDTAHVHLVVLSPDGRTRYDLNAWGCDESGVLGFSYAWLPNNAVSCLSDTGKLVIGAAPFRTPTTISALPRLTPGVEEGATWTDQGTGLIVTSLTDPTDPVHHIRNDALYVVGRTGVVTLQPLTPRDQFIVSPAWAPQQRGLTYLMDTNGGSGLLNLVLSGVTTDAQAHLVLGAPRTLARDVDQYYAWSPSGRWIAARYPDHGVEDRIYLLNVDNPAETVDVVVADRIRQQMLDPIWSPDGNTLIVFTVGYGTAQPYSLDIGAYLHSKGLQP
jgi:Tol biopolymer transport system component